MGIRAPFVLGLPQDPHGVMAHPFTPLFLLAAVAFAAPDALATPVQGLRGAISNSTGKARPVAEANLSAPGDDVESGGGKTCCKNGNDETKCYIDRGNYHVDTNN